LQFFQRKIALIILGVVLIGVTTATFVLFTSTATAKFTSPQANVATATATDANTNTATPTDTVAITDTATPGGVTVTNTPVPGATNTPVPTLVVGQTIDWTDTVVSVGTRSFTLRLHNVRVVVDNGTTFTGPVTSLVLLTRGRSVEVRGVVQTTTQVLATAVITQAGGD